MKLVIIAGGKGTRLGTANVPKPMTKIGDRSVLEHQLALAKRYGIREVIVISGHLANMTFDHLRDGATRGMRITHLIEPYPLGTAGSLALAKHLLTDRFLVFYGDVMLDMDLGRLIAFDRESHALATLVVHPNDHPQDSDLVEIDDQARIVAWHKKPRPTGTCHRNVVNAGVYVCSPEIFQHLAFGESSDFGRDVFPALIARGQLVAAYNSAEFVKDMGTPDRLAEIDHAYRTGRIARMNRAHRRRAIFLDRDGVVLNFVDHLAKPDDVVLARGAAEAIRQINDSEHLAVMVTNQPMLAKGMLTHEGLERIHARMETLLAAECGAYLDMIYHCPHHPERGFDGEVATLKIDCDCRKPKPGMLLEAARQLNVDLPGSWMIGDTDADLLAGQKAGCQTILIDPRPARTARGGVAADLSSAVQLILGKTAEIARGKVA
ncbi:MAG TPA: HAD-IIIA family hydrolase [Pirellulales bacterium]|nr:HAD-IIIA family hydrolase [Pirellulales bacterium]